MFHHILVPLDGTECAEQAIPLAARIARASGATLTLLNVIEVVPDSLTYPLSALSQERMDADRQRGVSYLSRIGARAYLRDLPVEMMLWFGPWNGSLADVKMEHIDLIVMYRHSNTDIRHYVMGSIVQYITCRGLIPMLLSYGQGERNNLHPFRILVALDGSKRAETAIRPAAMLSVLLSAPEPGGLHLLGVVRPTHVAINLASEEIIKQTDEEARATAHVYLESMKKKMFREIIYNFPLQISFSLCHGQDVPEILVDLVGLEQTLLLSSLNAFDSIARRLLGSVAGALLDCTHLPNLAEERDEKYVYAGRAAG